jgi:Zn-dependent M28 family amino/carboxypeptidase
MAAPFRCVFPMSQKGQPAYCQPALVCLFLAVVSASLAATRSAAGQEGLRLSTLEEVGAEFKSVPCKNKERQAAARALFERMGAPAADISIEKYRGVENLVLVKKGTTDEKIVVGAHYDKVDKGCGALDNWTGIVAIAHIYRSLASVKSNKTLLFVAFGREEEGLVGSSAMASRIDKAQAAQYCAMINIDTLGLSIPQVADNMSSKKLEELAESVAKELKIQFGHASIPGASTDSVAFANKKIPAVEIHAMTNNWMSILHTDNDQPAKVNATSVYLGYRLALAMIVRVDGSSCNAFR